MEIFTPPRRKVHSEWRGSVRWKVVKVWLGVTQSALSLMMSGVPSEKWKNTRLSARSPLCLFLVLLLLQCFFFLWRRPSCRSRLAAPEYSTELCDSIWTRGPRTSPNPPPLRTYTHTHTHNPFKKASFSSLKSKYSQTLVPFLSLSVYPTPSPLLLLLFITWATHTLAYTGFKTRRFDLHEVLALCIPPFKELCVRVCIVLGVCWCVKRMLMRGLVVVLGIRLKMTIQGAHCVGQRTELHRWEERKEDRRL